MSIGVRSPSNPINAGLMITQFSNGSTRNSHIEDQGLVTSHSKRRDVVRIQPVPGQTKQRCSLRVFVDNGGVFEMAEVEQPNATIST